MVPRENKNNGNAKFGGTKRIAVFSEMSCAFAQKMIPFFRFSLKLRSFLSLFFFRLSIISRRVFIKQLFYSVLLNMK